MDKEFTISASCTVILDGVTIGERHLPDKSALWIAPGCTVTVILKADTKSVLMGGSNGAGLEVLDNATLILQGPGTLEATGSVGGAGIGGGDKLIGNDGDVGSITITGGAQVTATGGGFGAGIGGGGGAADSERDPSVAYSIGGMASKSEIILPAAWYTAPRLTPGVGGTNGTASAQAGATVGHGGAACAANAPLNDPAEDFIKAYYPDWPIVPLINTLRYGGGLVQSGITFYPTPASADFTGTGELSFMVPADIRNFKAAYMDGVKLTEGEHFTLRDGSTILTLRESYLSTLSSGKHTLRMVFHSGEAHATVNVGVGYVPVEIELDPPKTGGDAGMGGLVLVLLTVGLCVLVRRQGAER